MRDVSFFRHLELQLNSVLILSNFQFVLHKAPLYEEL